MSIRFLMLIPVALLTAFAIYRRFSGRRLTRNTLDTLLALILLGYFLLTAGLGLFWVANQHLPVFDIHYLFGYVTLALVLVHVALNWAKLTAFFRKGLAPTDTAARRPRLRATGWVVGLTLYGAACFWIGRGVSGDRLEIVHVSAPPAATLQPDRMPAPHNPAVIPPHMAIFTGEEKPRMLADHYHEQTKHTRLSIATDAGVLNWTTKPDVFKAYPDAEVIALPPAAEHAGMSVAAAVEACRNPAAVARAKSMTLADLSTMLFMTNGITSTLHGGGRTYLLRAAPSAGALYPTITYVFVRNVSGLRPGIYHYAADVHKLNLIRPGADACAELAATSAHRHFIDTAPATFVYTSEFYRSAWKYRRRAYRYCTLDCGHLLVQTALSAAALNYASHPIGRFDDARLNALLSLDQSEEGAMAILPVGHIPQALDEQSDEPAFVADPAELEGRSGPLPLLIHGHTCLSVGTTAVRQFAPAPVTDYCRQDTPTVSLPKPIDGGDDLFPTIRRRRSVREWANPGIALGELSAVLHSAFAIEPENQRERSVSDVENHQSLKLYVIVNRVDGLEQGVYCYRHLDHSLAQLHRGEVRRRIYRACLSQDAVGNADACLAVTVDLHRLPYPDGDRGYRYAGLNAGMLGGRVYLRTTSMRLGCCGIGAYFDDEVSDILDADPGHELVIYLLAIGAQQPRP